MSYFGYNRECVGQLLEKEGVNGIALKDLEARSLPLIDRTQDKEGYKWRSSSGFLAEGETFQEVITQDWIFLEKYNITHSQLSIEIKKLIQTTRQQRNDQSNAALTLTYTPAFQLKNKSLSPQVFHPHFSSLIYVIFLSQTLVITPVWYVSPQYSLFYNPSLPPSPPPPSSSSSSSSFVFEENYMWQTEFEIENKDLELKIRVGGNEIVGVVLYIERYGFFEGGGVANDYRVDPSTLLSILSGVVFEETLRVVEEKKKIEQKQEQCFLENLKSQFEFLPFQDPEKSQMEKEWFEQNIQLQQKKIDDLKHQTKQTLQKLTKKI